MQLNIYTDRDTGRLAITHECPQGVVEAVPVTLDDGTPAGWVVLAWREDRRDGEMVLVREEDAETFEVAVRRVIEVAA